MKASNLPFNIEILELTPEKLRKMRPVSSTDIIDSTAQRLTTPFQETGRSYGLTTNLHDDGLFSIPIFGQVGDEERDKRFSYVNVGVKVFHPLVHKALTKIKGLYRDIMEGKRYAVWNPDEKDFEISNEADGETGFQFFVSHWEEINFTQTGSAARDQRIQMIDRYKDRAMVDKILILPAGLRDIRSLSSGRLDFDPINDTYRRIVGISQTISGESGKKTSKTHDYSRYLLQRSFNEIYAQLEEMLSGKKGLIQGKWASRRVFNGTRNVITSMDGSKRYLGGDESHRGTDTIVGLFQLMRGVQPLTIHLLRTGWLGNVFSIGTASTTAQVVDPKTWKRKSIEVPGDVKDRWTTLDGLNRVINSFQDRENRFKPVMIEEHYAGLIYKGPDMTFKIFGGIDELPKGFSEGYVEPLTLVELLYLSGYHRWNDVKAIVTRYPVSGTGSTYPSDVYVRTTIRGERRLGLNENWEVEEDWVASEFPTRDPDAWFESTSVSSSRLAGLNADFDGDTVSCNFLYSEDAIQEIERVLHSRQAYVDASGKLKTSVKLDTVSLVLRNMTGSYLRGVSDEAS